MLPKKKAQTLKGQQKLNFSAFSNLNEHHRNVRADDVVPLATEAAQASIVAQDSASSSSSSSFKIFICYLALILIRWSRCSLRTFILLQVNITSLPFVCTSRDEYRNMKWQWESMTKTQEKNFSEFRERKQLIGEDNYYVLSHQLCQLTFYN